MMYESFVTSLRSISYDKYYIQSIMRLLEVKDLTITIPQKVLCNKISFSIAAREKVALVAKNGAGKSSLFQALVGIRDIE
ncbi:MAG: ATP-binding cassette domain-containing protein [Candidatus Peribacteria bacterium]|nr:MAG: ATP-binding cassette domain-containing protein [Candidatus Peribacteria bacterium]